MKLLNIDTLDIPSIKVVKFARFCDHRGYFTEHFRQSQFDEELTFLEGKKFVQANESFSRKNVIRGLHFQWNPFMGKLVRTVSGRMVDIFLDIRKGSPTFGKCAMYELPATSSMDYSEWIWVPPGFAHGNYFTDDSVIEYFCTGEYSPGCEAGISPLSDDIDWSMCDNKLKAEFDDIVNNGALITDKDKDAPNIKVWTADERSNEFLYEDLK